jgi:hypothetical protein
MGTSREFENLQKKKHPKHAPELGISCETENFGFDELCCVLGQNWAKLLNVYVHTWISFFVFQFAFKILLIVIKPNLITYSKLSL